MTKITMITNTGCGYCNAARKITQTAAFQTWAFGGGIALTEAKYNSAEGKAALKLFGIKGTLKVPLMLATDDAGNKIGFISYRPSVRNRTPENLIAALTPLVCGGGCSPSTGETRKTCPTCKGVGTVLASIALSLVWMGAWTGVALSTGCVCDHGTYTVTAKEITKDGVVVTPEKTTVVEASRRAFLYPFEMGEASFVAPAAEGTTPASLGVKNYKTDGGAPGVVTIITASGQVFQAVAGKAVESAVAP